MRRTGGDGGEFGEPDVVADGNGDFAVFREVADRELVSGTEGIAFFECDLAGDVDVEEVDFAVFGDHFAGGGEHHAGVMVILGVGDVFGNGAAEDVCVADFLGHFMEHVVRGGLGLGRRVGEEGFGVGGEEGCAVRGVEAFWEDDEVGTGSRGFEDLGAGVREVAGFVGA